MHWFGERFQQIGRAENESEKHPENGTDSARGMKKFTVRSLHTALEKQGEEVMTTGVETFSLKRRTIEMIIA